MKNVINYILLCLILFSGCTNVSSDLNEWQNISDSVSQRIIEFEKNEEIEKIHIFKLNPTNFDVSIANSNPKYVSNWSKELNAEIVINGAYFNKDYTPSGYLKINNERIGELLFDQNRSGLIQIDNGEFSIRDLAVNPLQTGEELDFGLQSYPFLIKNSIAAINEDSGKIARRTALGVDQEGWIYIIFADKVRISLYELMNKLVDSGIDFTYVLNLDGGPSSGLVIDLEGYDNSRHSIVKVPSVILFKKGL